VLLLVLVQVPVHAGGNAPHWVDLPPANVSLNQMANSRSSPLRIFVLFEKKTKDSKSSSMTDHVRVKRTRICGVEKKKKETEKKNCEWMILVTLNLEGRMYGVPEVLLSTYRRDPCATPLSLSNFFKRKLSESSSKELGITGHFVWYGLLSEMYDTNWSPPCPTWSLVG